MTQLVKELAGFKRVTLKDPYAESKAADFMLR